MTDQFWIAVTFISFLILFIIVGVYSATQKQATTTDYLLASRNVNPWLTALSALATGQSGLLFIGQVGFAYKVGISALWLTIGWAIGDYIAWWLIFRRLREVSEAKNSETVSEFLGQASGKYRLITLVSAIITITFLGTYAAAQLVAGSKALNSVFGWDYSSGVIIGAVVVAVYCFSGGIRASIWTDAIQAIIMMISLLILSTVALVNCGGFQSLWIQLMAIDSDLINWNPESLQFGFIPFFLGWIGAGFGVVGQPHIVVRAMAINSSQNIAFARDLKLLLATVNSCCAIVIGIAARVLLPDLLNTGDPELALPYLSLELLPGFLVGLMMAGLFSATISTADSQILSCSAALTQDIFPQGAKSYRWIKIGTLTVTAIVLAIALIDNNSVFSLITFSWSALAAGLGPLLIVRVLQKPVTTGIAIAMMLSGILMAFIWNLGLGLSGAVYEVLPGMLSGTCVYLIGHHLNMLGSESDSEV
ncbi:MAG: sodium/proline symporter [Oscillatoriales cyanobacterium RM2_1_1]|nr:sodium/proline symporter [Oscillatoriales cyanobacterium SM2_3_0]NJO44402.1 sodium/proline symporter [Oscillatoriales cyanobacterium RM2_1_1]